MRKKWLIVHHSATPDNLTLADFVAIKRYHTSYAIDGNIVSEAEFFRRADAKDGKHFKRKWTDIGYNSIVEYLGWMNDPCIVRGRPLNIPAVHARGWNEIAYGVCAVGAYDVKPPDSRLLDTLAWHTATLYMRKLGVKIENIIPHRQVAPYKSCPGKLFPWKEYKLWCQYYVEDSLLKRLQFKYRAARLRRQREKLYGRS